MVTEPGMSPTCDGVSHSGCKEAEDSCLPLPLTGSQQSSVSGMFERPMPTLVYHRRKKRRDTSSSGSAVVANFCAQEPVNSRRSVDCLSVTSSDALSEAIVERKGISQVEHETATVRAPMATLNSIISKYEFANGCSGLYNQSSDVHKTVVQKTVDVDSMNDSCSSSKSDMGLALASMKDGMDANGECTSSSVVAAEVVREELSEKDACHHILESQGNDDEVVPSRPCVNGETRTTGGGCGFSRLCKTCGCSGTVQKMLICDSCEEGFHVRCCIPRIKKLPVDDWYCTSCMNNKRIMLKEATASKASSITSGMGRCRDVSHEGEFSPIELMLRDTEPHRTSVRIGKGYQSDVPDWSGPIDNDVDTIGEPLELDPSEYTNVHESNCSKLNKLSLIGNWLQCRESVEGVEGNSGTICGKWRRAPLFEVQTDNWECFCSFLWDPSHADCSVPQEMETDEVLKQLKYVEMLRPRLSADWPKSDQTNRKSPVRKDDTRNPRSSSTRPR